MTGGLVGGLEEAKAHIRWTPMEQRARRASSTGERRERVDVGLTRRKPALHRTGETRVEK